MQILNSFFSLTKKFMRACIVYSSRAAKPTLLYYLFLFFLKMCGYEIQFSFNQV